MRGLQQWVGELPVNPLDIHIYPGKASRHVIYLDDGETTKAEQNGAYRTCEITHAPTAGGRQIKITRLHDNYMPPEDHFTMTLWSTPSPVSVRANGVALAAVATAAAFDVAALDCYYFDAGRAAVRIKLMDDRPAMTLELA
jgi:alpha-glucosidase